MRRTVLRRLSSFEGFSRSFNRRSSRRRSSAVCERYGAPSRGPQQENRRAVGQGFDGRVQRRQIFPDLDNRHAAHPRPRSYSETALLSISPRICAMKSASGLAPWSPCLRLRTATWPLSCFAAAHHQHVRDLLQLRLADLQVDLLAAVVHRGADAGRVELLPDGARVIRLPVGDGQHDGLHAAPATPERRPHNARSGCRRSARWSRTARGAPSTADAPCRLRRCIPARNGAAG